MLTIYNFSFHKSPQYGYDRQKKKGKTAISPLLTFNLKVVFTFSLLSPLACFAANSMCQHIGNIQKTFLWYVILLLQLSNYVTHSVLGTCATTTTIAVESVMLLS